MKSWHFFDRKVTHVACRGLMRFAFLKRHSSLVASMIVGALVSINFSISQASRFIRALTATIMYCSLHGPTRA